MIYNCILIVLTLIPQFHASLEGVCDKDVKGCELKTRYIFYDVNPPEGFNLRRDVYLRYAIFVHKLVQNNDINVKLVLPPWSRMFHWKRSEEPEHLPWGLFFDIDSMQKFAPAIELYTFFNELKPTYGDVIIDEVYILQHYQDMFTSGNFEDKMSIEDCNEQISTNFFHYDNITSHNIKCLSFHGFTSQLSSLVHKSEAQTILFDHAEVPLHDRFGDRTYWECRRSMRFNKELIFIANEFRRQFLNSMDEKDGTILPDDWRNEKSRRNALGGPYLSVHLRRRDFVWGRPKHVPNIKNAAKQIQEKLDHLQLDNVFIATDASNKEYEELKEHLSNFNVFKYNPNKEVKKKYKDGGVAIIEQIICSYARYFMGTYESTFSFRIQEEREILGFPESTTFNRLCGNEEPNCEKTSMWRIEY